MNRLEFFRSLVSVGLLLVAVPAVAQSSDAACPREVELSDADYSARIRVSEIQAEVSRAFAGNARTIIKKLEPISFSARTGAVQVSGVIAIPAEKLLARISMGNESVPDLAFAVSVRPSVQNECGQSYISLEFLRVEIEQTNLLPLFPMVQNLVEATLDDDAVRGYLASMIAKPLKLPVERVSGLFDRKNLSVDGDKKIIKLRLDFERLANDFARGRGANVLANPTIAEELRGLRLWSFGPVITRTSGAAEKPYDAKFLIELGHGVPDKQLRAEREAKQAVDQQVIQQAMAADLAKYGDPGPLLQIRASLINDAKAKLSAAKGAPLGYLELQKIAGLERELDAMITSGVRADNPLFYGDPETQVRELQTSMNAKVQATFAVLTSDSKWAAKIEKQASELRPGDVPFVEERTSEQALNTFLRFVEVAQYQGEQVVRELSVSLNPPAEELTLKGLLHINIPGYTKGFLDPKVAQGISGFAGNYLPFRITAKLRFTPEAKALFNFQTLILELPDSTDFVIRRENSAGSFLFNKVEALFATQVVPKIMAGANASLAQKLSIDTFKGTRPTMDKDMLVLDLDLATNPLLGYIPKNYKDLRAWRVGFHDSATVGRKFFELAAGGGPVSQTFWQEQAKRQREQVSRLEQSVNGQRLSSREIPVDMQFRFSLPGLKERIDDMLKGVNAGAKCQYEAALRGDKFATVVVPDKLTVDAPLQAELEKIEADIAQDNGGRIEKLTDVFKVTFDGRVHAVHIMGESLFRGLRDYSCRIQTEVYFRPKLIDVADFTGKFLRPPVYLGRQVFELEIVNLSGRSEGGFACTVINSVARGFNLDDTDFKDRRSARVKTWLLKNVILPRLDNDKGSYLIHSNGNHEACMAPGTTAAPSAPAQSGPEKVYHLNSYLRFFSTEDRFAFQLNPRLFGPLVDLQVVHPLVATRPGLPEVLFDGKRVGLRIDNDPKVNQASLDVAVRPTLAASDEESFGTIVSDADTLLRPLFTASSREAFLQALAGARLRDRFLKPMSETGFEQRSIVGRLERLAKIYPYISRRGNHQEYESPEGLGTGVETVTYAKTLIQIEKMVAATIQTAQRFGLQAQLLSDPELKAFVDRHQGVRADRSDSIQVQRIQPLLATYKKVFQPRNQLILSTPVDSDWTKDFRKDAEKAERIFNEISR